MKRISFLPLVFVVGLAAPHSYADLIVNFTEVGSDILLTYNGEIDLRATTNRTGSFDGYFPSTGAVGSAGGGINLVDVYPIDVPWTPFGSGSRSLLVLSSQTGDPFALFTDPSIGVPSGYQSLAPISGTALHVSQSFDGSGLTEGIYSTTFSNGDFFETVTVNVVRASDVPVPGTLALIGLGLAGFGWKRRKA